MKNIRKNNLNKPVTKGQFDLAIKDMGDRMDGFDNRMDSIDARFDAVDARMDRLEDKIDNAVVKLKNYVDNRFDEFAKIIYTKADHQVFMTWMDEAMKELRDAREGRVLAEEQMLRLDDKVANHESRICLLEGK